MAFGKADIGLIKATAGAEAGQHIDENLMLGSAIGGALDTISKQQEAVRKQNKKLQKEIDEKFTVPTGNLDPALMEYTYGTYENSTRDYSSFSGTDYYSKTQKARILDIQNKRTQQVDNLQGLINWSRDKNNKLGAGASDQDIFFRQMIQKGEGLQFFDMKDEHGDPTVSMAVPRKSAPKQDATITALLDDEKNETIDAEGIAALKEYRDSVEEYNTWQALGDTDKHGNYNPEKYKIYNGNNMPQGEDVNNKANLLGTWNANVTTKIETKDLKVNQTAENLALEWNKVWDADNANASGAAVQDIAFGDFSEDGIDNSFGSIFIEGANTDKHPDLYTNTDGTPLSWNLKDLGFKDPEIAQWDKEVNGVKDGVIEWSNEPGSEWMALPDETKKMMKDVWIRGTDSDGNSDPDKRVDWIKSKYAKFMGQVTLDAYKQKQRNHFEMEGTYFDSQGTGGDQNIDPIFANVSDMQAQKTITYNTTKLDIALPESFITDGIKTDDPQGLMGEFGGNNLKKALPNLNSSFTSTFSVDGSELVVETDGEDDETFDFSGDINTSNEYKRLKMFLAKQPTTGSDDVNISNLGTSVDDENWQTFQNQKYDNYPGERVGQKFTGGQYEKFILNGQEVSDQNIEIIGYYPEDGTYEVQVNGADFGRVNLELKK